VNPSDVVFGSVVVIVSTTLVRRIREGKWEGHVLEILIFGFLLLISLQLLVLVVPNVAKTLAYLGLVGAFILNGPAIFGYASKFNRTTIGGVGRGSISHAGEMRRATR
jgi:hypothetical protein